MDRLLTPEEEYEYYQFAECLLRNLMFNMVDYSNYNLNMLKCDYRDDDDLTVRDLYKIRDDYIAQCKKDCKCEKNPIEFGTRLLCDSCLNRIKRTAGINNQRKLLRILTREEFESKGLFTSDEQRRMTLNPKFEYTFMNSGYIYMRRIDKSKIKIIF